MKASDCGDPKDLKTQSAFTIPPAPARWELLHSRKVAFFARYLWWKHNEIKRQLWVCHQRALLGQWWMKWHACCFCIYQHKHPVPEPSPSFLFTFRSQITSSHFNLFPFFLLWVVKQCSHFNVNSAYADGLLNPAPHSVQLSLKSQKEVIRETCMCL